MEKKLIVSDIDGTLLRSDKTISEDTKNEIFNWINEGHAFAIATGRMHGAGRLVTRLLDYDGFLISCNGAVVKHLKTGEVIQAVKMDKEIVRKVAQICRKHGAYYHFYDINAIYAEKKMHLAEKFFNQMRELPEEYHFDVFFVEDILVPLEGIDVYKVGIYSEDPKTFQAIIDEVNTLEGVETCKSLETSFDVMAKGVTKALGIQALEQYYKIPRERVISFGDNENDMDMIEYAGQGVAMANATEPLKAIANFVTKSNDEDGIVYFLRGRFL